MPDIDAVQLELGSSSGGQDPHFKYDLRSLSLETNQGAITPDQLGWLTPFRFPSDDLSSSAGDEAVRKELEDKGVVWIKGVIPPELVFEMRRRYFDFLSPTGLLRDGSDPTDGIFSGRDPRDFVGPDNAIYIGRSVDDCEHAKRSIEAWHSDWAEAFNGNEHLMKAVGRLKPDWAEPFIFKRQMIRSNVPTSSGCSTGVHYDQIFLRAAGPTALTAWVPIGDCSPLQGGLMYLEDSRGLAEELENDFTRRAAEAGFDKRDRISAFNVNMMRTGMLSHDAGDFARTVGGGRKWLIGDYEAGDVVFHHAYMIHASGANRDPEGKIRLSADLRFADRQGEYDKRWQNQFSPDDGL